MSLLDKRIEYSISKRTGDTLREIVTENFKGTIIDKVKIASHTIDNKHIGSKTAYIVYADDTNEISTIEPYQIKKLIV